MRPVRSITTMCGVARASYRRPTAPCGSSRKSVGIRPPAREVGPGFGGGHETPARRARTRRLSATRPRPRCISAGAPACCRCRNACPRTAPVIRPFEDDDPAGVVGQSDGLAGDVRGTERRRWFARPRRRGRRNGSGVTRREGADEAVAATARALLKVLMRRLLSSADQLFPIASSTLEAVKSCGSMIGSPPLPL